MSIRRFLLAAAAGAALLLAVDRRNWTQSEFSEFDKGTLKGLSLSSLGRVTLAPALTELHDAGVPLLWVAVADSKGNVYAAGAEGKIFRTGTDGKTRLLATIPGGDIYALAVNRGDELFAATSPDGRIHRLRGEKAEAFYDSKQKYIWALAFDAAGNLYAATGDKGEIHRVAPNGQGSVFHETGETHVRSLAIDAAGNLYAGTDPGGMVMRINARGEGFVVYQTPRREVTALAVAADGTVYAAGVGQKAPAAPPAAPPPAPAPPSGGGAPGGVQIAVTPVRVPPPPTFGAAPSVSGGSEIYRIAPDGAPRRVWSHASLLVYGVAFDASQKLLVATGNNGQIFRLDSDTAHTRLLDLEPQQVTGLAAGRGGAVYAVTSNPGKLYRLGPALEKSGTLESDVFDANAFTYWGRLRSEADPRGGSVKLETRSGNLDRPGRNWSPWAAPGEGGRIASPPARFLTWRATLQASPDGSSPVLSLVEAAYQAKNTAPYFERIEITPPNYKFPSSSLTLSSSASSLTLPPIGQPRRSSPPSGSTGDSGSQSMTAEHGMQGVRWRVADPNGDTLEAKVEIRGKDEREWKVLKTGLRDSKFSFDATAWPDGEYRIRVTVTDEPDNYPGQALSAQIESEPFLIDHTPPRIENLTATAQGNKLVIRFRATDALSPLEDGEVSINGGEWRWAEPATKISDSPSHEYSLEVDKPAGSEFTIAVKISDNRDNQAVQKAVLR